MQLYGSFTSPYARHCRIALEETSLQAEFIAIDQQQSAQTSPTKRIPMLKDGDITLSDSQSILKHLREKSGQTFLARAEDLDFYCFCNTLLDSAANIFYLEKFGLNLESNDYTKRQQNRIDDGLKLLEQQSFKNQVISNNDGLLRLACFLDWAVFRNRIQLDKYPTLNELVQQAKTYEPFAKTYPFE